MCNTALFLIGVLVTVIVALIVGSVLKNKFDK